MHKHRIRTALFSRDRRYERQLGAVSDEDLVLLFDDPNAELGEPSAPSGSRFPAARSDLALAASEEDEVVLTLGGARTAVRVKPDRPDTVREVDPDDSGLPVPGWAPPAVTATSSQAVAEHEGPTHALVTSGSTPTRKQPAPERNERHVRYGEARRDLRRAGTKLRRFSWRRLVVSAAISSGLGLALLLALSWLVG